MTWGDGPVPQRDRRPGSGWRGLARRLAARIWHVSIR
jgi:hypothetical protein